jgi:hypothetical protein
VDADDAAVGQLDAARALDLHEEDVDRVGKVEQLQALALQRTLLDLRARRERLDTLVGLAGVRERGADRPTLRFVDQVVSGLILDLEERGLLESTLVIVMGEMGRSPQVNGKAGRDHWPQCGFALLAGGGIKRGFVVGKTDEQAAYPVDRPVSAGDMVATVYQLLGINPALTVEDLSGRPIGISHGGEPVWEAIA